jgi:hypothetical protein
MQLEATVNEPQDHVKVHTLSLGKNDHGHDTLVSIDCTAVEIQEPSQFHQHWWSHKFYGPGIYVTSSSIGQ